MLFTERMDWTRFQSKVSSVSEPSERFEIRGYEELQVLYTKNIKKHRDGDTSMSKRLNSNAN